MKIKKMTAFLLAAITAVSMASCNLDKSIDESKAVSVNENTQKTELLSEMESNSKEVAKVEIAGVEYNTELTELALNISEKETDISNIKYLTNLKDLSICGCSDGAVSVLSINSLSSLNNLEKLNIAGVGINDNNFSAIKDCLNLTELHMTMMPINDISWIANLKSLETLELMNTNIDNITVVGDLDKLKYLRISESPIQDIECLKKMINLETLNISTNSNITDEQINDLKESLPNCSID